MLVASPRSWILYFGLEGLGLGDSQDGTGEVGSESRGSIEEGHFANNPEG